MPPPRNGLYAVSIGDEVAFRGELGTATAVLRSRLLGHMLAYARGRAFIHAACVGYRGTAILIPGQGNSGKSTLAAALVRAGALYYTDDYAPIDGGMRTVRSLSTVALAL